MTKPIEYVPASADGNGAEGNKSKGRRIIGVGGRQKTQANHAARIGEELGEGSPGVAPPTAEQPAY